MSPKKLLKAANCKMRVICERNWDDFEETELDGVRFCNGCAKVVFYTCTVQELKVAAEKGLCVYIAPSFYDDCKLDNERTKTIEAEALLNIGKLTGSIVFKNEK